MYPSLPENRVYVEGEDICLKYGLVLLDGYVLTPPEAKEHKVDVPGRSGSIDLMDELLGDAVYQNTTHELEFVIINPSDTVEETKTTIKNIFDGKMFNYSFSMDPEYTYTGRWNVETLDYAKYSYPDLVMTVKFKIDVQPFKHKIPQKIEVNAVGGTIIKCDSGRERVQPIIKCGSDVSVIWKEKEFKFSSGSYTLEDITFEKGQNELYLCSFEITYLTWGMLAEHKYDQSYNHTINWQEFGLKKLYEWYNTNLNSDSYHVMNMKNGDVFPTQRKTSPPTPLVINDYVGVEEEQSLPIKVYLDSTKKAFIEFMTKYDTASYDGEGGWVHNAKTTWTYAWPKWNDTKLNIWKYYKTKTWNDLRYKKEITKDIPNINITYEWGDL